MVLNVSFSFVQIDHGSLSRLIIYVMQMVESIETLWKVSGFRLKHIKKLSNPENVLKAVNPSDVQGQCIFMAVDDVIYCTTLPYGCVGD